MTIYPEIWLESQYPPSAYDEEFVVASISSLVNNLEMIDNLFPKQLANRKLSPYRLIKKRAESNGTSNAQLNSNHFILCISGQTFKHGLTLNLSHLLTSQFQNQSDIQNRKFNLPKNQKRYNERPPDKMKKQNMKKLTGVLYQNSKRGNGIHQQRTQTKTYGKEIQTNRKI